jgi:hypothetical protein
MFLLDDKIINNICSYTEGKEEENMCNIIIKIKSEDNYKIDEDPSTHINFSIQLTENDLPMNPIYLPQNNFISNILIPNFPQIYYVDMLKDGTGKIYVDFLEGGGYAEGVLKNEKKEIVKKINFDEFNKFFKISKNLTEDCDKEDNCKIYIKLSSDDYMYKYNIYSKLKINENEYNKYFLVPENEYIYGNLDQNEIHY